MQTHTTTRPARKVNLTAALASAEDDFEVEANMFGPVVQRDLNRDRLDMEVVARLTLNFTNGLDKLFDGMSYAAKPKWDRTDLRAMLLDLISDQMQHGAGAVVAANLAKMESE